jgi:acetate kinase
LNGVSCKQEDPAISDVLSASDLDLVPTVLGRSSNLLPRGARALLRPHGHPRVAGDDLRDLLAHERDDGRAAIAIEVFCYRLQNYIGAYFAALGGAQAVVFTGAIGEWSAEVRARVCQGLECVGLILDPRADGADDGSARRISASGAGLAAFVIPTDEESEIARGTVQALRR